MVDYANYPELSSYFKSRYKIDPSLFESWLDREYGASEADGVHPSSTEYTVYVAHAWSLGTELSGRYRAEAIGKALWLQVGQVDWYLSPTNGGRILWDAALLLYTNVLEPLADDTLGHLSERGGKLQDAVYMFWDAARWYAGEPATDLQRAAFLKICERALRSPKASVQESALHGLGHATPYLPEAKRMIEGFLRKAKPRRKDLRRYAENALTNGIN